MISQKNDISITERLIQLRPKAYRNSWSKLTFNSLMLSLYKLNSRLSDHRDCTSNLC